MDPVISVSGLSQTYKTRRGDLKALEDISFDIGVGQTLAVVGESGCGKTTLALALLGLLPLQSGTIRLRGAGPRAESPKADTPRNRNIGVVFQNPNASFNPRMRVSQLVGEPLFETESLRGRKLAAKVAELLDLVGLGAAFGARFPHELSGGQLQRVAIARALALDPDLLLLDEPTSALDVSVQAQILNLLKSIQRKTGKSYLFITHDLGTVDYLAHRVMVMYLGRIIETGPVDAVFKNPEHPYTKALLEAVPRIDSRLRGQFAPLQGEIPSPIDRPPGCAFSPRCPMQSSECQRKTPGLVGGPDRQVACIHSLIGGTQKAETS